MSAYRPTLSSPVSAYFHHPKSNITYDHNSLKTMSHESMQGEWSRPSKARVRSFSIFSFDSSAVARCRSTVASSLVFLLSIVFLFIANIASTCVPWFPCNRSCACKLSCFSIDASTAHCTRWFRYVIVLISELLHWYQDKFHENQWKTLNMRDTKFASGCQRIDVNLRFPRLSRWIFSSNSCTFIMKSFLVDVSWVQRNNWLTPSFLTQDS